MVCNLLVSDFVDLFCDRPLFQTKKVTMSDDNWIKNSWTFTNWRYIGRIFKENRHDPCRMILLYVIFIATFLPLKWVQYPTKSKIKILRVTIHVVWVQNACLKNLAGWMPKPTGILFRGLNFWPSPQIKYALSKLSIHCLLRQHLGYDLGCWLPSGEVFGLDSSIMLDS